MSDEIAGNPVLLWGDKGPDVYKLSQIYNPVSDKYVRSLSISVTEGTTYFERLELILSTDENVKTGRKYYSRTVQPDGTVVFDLVINPTGQNPRQNGWYQNAGGKILVFKVVDLSEYTDPNPYELGWFELNTASAEDMIGKIIPSTDSLILVDKVDCAYKVSNPNFRDRMLLTVESVDEDFNVTFAPIVFGSDTEETVRAIDYGNERFMLFFDRKGENNNIVLTPDRKLLLYGAGSTFGYRIKKAGQVISTNRPAVQKVVSDGFIPYARANAKRVTVTSSNYETLRSEYIDIVLDNGLQRTVKLPEAATLVPTCDATFVANRRYYAENGECIADCVNNASQFVGKSIEEFAEAGGYDVVYSYAGDDPSTPTPDGTYLGRTAFVHSNAADVLSNVYVPEKCWLRANVGIVDGEVLALEVYEFDTASNAARMCMNIKLVAKEATALDITDVTTRQIVNFDVLLNGSSTIGDIWYLQQGDNWKNAFVMTPRIGFDDGSYENLIIDNSSCFVYGLEDVKSTVVGREYQILFKFFPHKSLNVDWQKIGISSPTSYLTVRKTIKIINDLSDRIRKISMIPVWNHEHGKYELRYMVFRNDYTSPEIVNEVTNKYSLVMYVKTKDTVFQSGKDYFYRTNAGQFFRYIAVIGAAVSSAGRTIYEAATQSAIGLANISYVETNGEILYIDADTAGMTFDVTQRAIVAVSVVDSGVSVNRTYTQPIAFKLQPMNVTNEPYKWLIADDPDEILDTTRLPYGGGPVRPMIVYDEAAEAFKVDPNINFDTFKGIFWEQAMPPKGMIAEDTSAESITPSHFFLRSIAHEEVVSGFIPFTADGFADSVSMPGGGLARDDVGGSMPQRIVPPSGVGEIEIHGTVVVEFVREYVDPDNPTKKVYKHLYAVPVETTFLNN